MRSYNRYCTYCGVENNKKNKRCIACDNVMKSNDKLLKEYLLKNLDEKSKLKMSDSFVKILFRYLKNHLYGYFTMIVLIVCLVISIVHISDLIIIKQDNVRSVKNIKNIKSCVINDSVPAKYVCEEGYELEYKKCIKYNMVDANSTKTCDNDSEMFDGRCYSKANTEFIDGKACPDYVNGQNVYYKYENQSKKCVEYKCNSINFTNEIVTCNSAEEKTGNVMDPVDKQVCPEGFQALKGSCKRVTNPIDYYSCMTGELVENKCKIKEIVDSQITCDEGYILDANCKICIKEQ